MKVIEVTNVDFSLRHFLLPIMRGVRARGHEVIGACAEGELLAEVRAEGFSVAGLPFERNLSLAAHARGFRSLVMLFRAEKPDLVHAHMPISGFLARAAAKAAGVPRIAYTCHGFLFNQDGSIARRAGGFAMEWLGARMTDIYLTVSAAEARDARRFWIARRAIAVGNGRDPARFRPDPRARERIRTELGVPADRVVVIAVSRLVRDKGYPELAAAMREVPEVELWVVGERLASDRGDDMHAFLAAAGLGPRLRLLGYRHDVDAVLAAADIFVLPSYFEAMPMTVIEAMMTGLPVVASRVGGIREQVADGTTGLLVPPRQPGPLAEALRRLASDPDLRARMGSAGRSRAVELYDEAKVVGRTLDLLGL
ncbi:MAG TPA: glycosyltransferase family 4 protein [Acetobacteraceae bacterium]|nr:glycosyltransferase family 4 protein [Acetobacteraceae bacterium]